MGLSRLTFCAHLDLSIAVTAVLTIVFFSVQTGLNQGNFGNLDLAFFPILGTNVLSTGLIAWKAWCALLVSDPDEYL